MTKEADKHVSHTPAAGAEQAESGRRPGAPRGNQNRTSHGLYRGKKRTRPANADRYDEQGRRYARKTFQHFNKPDDPRRGVLADIEAGLRRTKARCDLRGWFDSSGEQKEAAKQYYLLLDRKAELLAQLESERLKASGQGSTLTTLILQANEQHQQREAEREAAEKPEPESQPLAHPEPIDDARDDGPVAPGVVAAVAAKQTEPADLADAVRSADGPPQQPSEGEESEATAAADSIAARPRTMGEVWPLPPDDDDYEIYERPEWVPGGRTRWPY